MSWRTFKASISDFKTKKDYDEYRELSRCAICHEKLEVGEEFDLRSVDTIEEREKFNGSKFNSLAVIVHRKCLEGKPR